MYEASLEKVTVTDFVKDNFLVVSVMLITFFGMILGGHPCLAAPVAHR